MKPMRPYMLDDAATLEYQRLDLMSRILDPWTRGCLADLRVGPGWQCLELGSGNGSIVECRALLHQITEYAPAVLAQMAAAVKPGGWLLAQEPDSRPDTAEYGQQARSGAAPGEDRRAE